ncbi:STY0301 family protein [Nitrospirillum sp. BR 11163]|uniref:STY0301 family protein n=1 Tax=Nitrospirillum sp. BR 11163 TaxID=3104323 RepID=UPI002AFE2BA2|nr:STY0301 family protein [Nitrospirillum sp. BR 11163]MEA1676072.1 STY0301 family protein [Nitrospirillum sp. BR 11163]
MIKPIFFIVTILTATASSAAESLPQCPKTLGVVESAQDVPAGFTALQGRNPPVAISPAPLQHPLMTVLFSEGPPAEQAWLVPDMATKSLLTWKFQPLPGHDIWMACAYAATTLITVTKMPAGIKECKVSYEHDGNIVTGTRCH